MLSVGTSYVDDTLYDVDGGDLEIGDEVIFAYEEVGETTGLTYGTDAFSSIGDAIGATDSGGTVNVATGLYAESVTIDRALVLDGVTGTASDVVIDPPSGNGITLAADGITVRDLKVTDAFDGIAGDGVDGVSAVTLNNVETIDNTRYGVVLTDIGALSVTDMVVDGNADGGLHVEGAASVLVDGGAFTDNDSGVYLADVTGDVDVLGVTFDQNPNEGLLVVGAGSVTIDGGLFTNNDSGALLLNVTGAVDVLGATVDGNVNDGLGVSGADSVAIDGGSFTGNGQGISLSSITGAVALTDITADANLSQSGLDLSGAASVVVSGGSFSSNAYAGIRVSGVSGTVDVNGGMVADWNMDSGLYVSSSGAVTISGANSFSGNNYGVYLDSGISGAQSITGATFTSNMTAALHVDDGDAAIGQDDANPATYSNTFVDNMVGVEITGGTVTIEDNFFNMSWLQGILVAGVSTVNITNNLMTDNVEGILVSDGTVTVSDCTMSGPWMFSGFTLMGGVTTITQNLLIGGDGVYYGGDGIYALGPAQARIIDNPAITGWIHGLTIAGATVMIENNNLNGNEIGVALTGECLVDIGQLPGSTDDFTGLGVSSGGNDFSEYTPAGAYFSAILNHKYHESEPVSGPQGIPIDTPAFGNTWYSVNPADIEDVIYHDPDRTLYTFVDYAVLSDLNVAMVDDPVGEGAIATLSGSFVNDPQEHTVVIDWGDTTSDTVVIEQSIITFDVDHVYADQGDYTINVTLTDSQGGELTDFTTVGILNVDPTITEMNAEDGDEGQLLAFSATATDPGDDTLTYTWDFGDESETQSGTDVSHTYDDDGLYTVTLTVTDEDGGETIQTAPVTVDNVAPTVSILGAPAEPQIGVPIDLSASVTDPGVLDTHTYAWSVTLDGAPYADGIDPTFSFTPADTGIYVVTLTVTDDDDGEGTDSIDVELSNQIPTVAADNPLVVVDEGTTATNTGTFEDLDVDDDVTITASAGTVTKTGTHAGTWSWSYDTTDGPYEETLTITADDGRGGVATTTFELTVDNVAPTLDDAPLAVEENTLDGTVVGTIVATDPGDDAVTYSVVGGTGTTAFAVDSETGEITVADQTELDYEYLTSFTLEVEAVDEDGGTDTGTITIDLINRPSITGAVFVDVNEDGLYDAQEPAIDDVIIELLDESGNPVLDGEGLPITAVCTDGYYLFEDLVAGTYQLHEIQPTGVDDGAELLGSLGGSIPANDTMQLTLETTDAQDYLFAELGDEVERGDTATVGFWNSWRGRRLIQQSGTGLAQWLTDNFTNVFGDRFEDADGYDVARFFRRQLFFQRGRWSFRPARVDAEFMATAMATYFTNVNLAGSIAVGYGFNVTETGIGANVVNVGNAGAAFGVDNGTDLTIMQLLQATDSMTDVPDNIDGYAHVYDQDGNGWISFEEFELRWLARWTYWVINISGRL